MSKDDIWLAANRGSLFAVTRFIDAHGLPAVNKQGDSLLTIACRAGHANVVAYLVDIGADENGLRDPQHAPHAFEAMRNGHLEVIQAICENGWGLQTHAVESKYGSNLIDDAAFHRQTEIVGYLLEQGHEIDMDAVLERDGRFCPAGFYDHEEKPLAIEWAMRAGAADWVAFLCEVGADVGEYDCAYYHERALLVAASRLTKPAATPMERSAALAEPTPKLPSIDEQWRDAKFTFKDYLILVLGWAFFYFVCQIGVAPWNWLSARF